MKCYQSPTLYDIENHIKNKDCLLFNTSFKNNILSRKYKCQLVLKIE